ncbi:uncharacterized protein [Musca autumnalis]|uniref:uncharacterized protein n=1 Tax=Musca autumnalis TaxID=221902 RepID=UPI003CEF2340
MSLDSFIRLADTLVGFDADLANNILPVNSVHLIRLHTEEIKSLWTKYKSEYDTFVKDYVSEAHEEEESGDEDQASELDTIRAKFKTIYLTYCKCIAKLSEISDELRADAAPKQSPAQSSPVPQSHSSNIHSGYSFNLPPCDLEVFSGDSMAWPTFRDMFTAMYIDNSRLSSVEKLFHLVQKTKGEAKEIVQKSPLTNSGFSQAWSNLSDRYENKRVLVNGQLKVLFNLPTVHSESSQGLKRLQRDINSCISVLKTYDIDVKSWDPIFVFLCSNRLPDSTLTLWEQTLSDKSSIPRWAELDKFLTNRYLTLESVSEMRRGVPGSSHKENSSEGKSKPSKKLSSFQSKVSDPKCPLCPNEVHIIRKCPKFLRMNPDVRSSEIKRQGLCLNCFSKTHSVKNCPSKHNCYTCNKRHNTLLHKIPANSASSVPSSVSNTASNSNLNPNSASFSRSEIQSTSNGVGNVQSYFSTNTQGVLLGTAMVQIVHNGVTYSARALFDSGSEGTFITERLFNQIKLPFKRANAQISGLNNSNSASVRKQCTFILSSKIDRKFELTVSAFIIPKLSGNLPSHSLPTSFFKNLPNISLADPNFFKSSQIDLLFGSDVVALFLLKRPSSDGS